MSGCLFLCAFHVLSPFAFDMSNCRGKTYCKSFGVLWVFVIWEAGFCSLNLPPWPSPPRVVCLAERVMMSDDMWWVTDYHERLTYSTIPLLRLFLVPSVLYPREVCVNQMSAWAKIPVPLFAHSFALTTLPPPLTPSPLTPLPPVSLSE